MHVRLGEGVLTTMMTTTTQDGDLENCPCFQPLGRKSKLLTLFLLLLLTDVHFGTKARGALLTKNEINSVRLGGGNSDGNSNFEAQRNDTENLPGVCINKIREDEFVAMQSFQRFYQLFYLAPVHCNTKPSSHEIKPAIFIRSPTTLEQYRNAPTPTPRRRNFFRYKRPSSLMAIPSTAARLCCCGHFAKVWTKVWKKS